MIRIAGVGLAVLVVLLAAPTDAQSETARDAYARARSAEEAFEPARALDAYRQVVEADPTGRLAARARRRITFLEERDEGAMEPLAALLRAQASDDAASLTELEELLHDFPAGLVRRETHPVLAEGWMRLGDTERALAAYRRWKDDPVASESERSRAVAGIARLLEREDRTDEAIAMLDAEAMNESAVAEELRRSKRRGWLRIAAVAGVVIFFIVLFGTLRFRWLDPAIVRQVLRPGMLLLGAYLLGIPWLVAVLYDQSAMDTFALLALSLAPLLVASGCAGRALDAENAPAWKRRVVVAGALLAHASVGYLVLLARGLSLLGFAA